MEKFMVNILLAEDDKNFARVLKRELEEDHHTVDHVNNGIEAVLAFIDHAYQFVLLDIKMPGLNGNDALRIIKKLSPSVPIITFSGNAGLTEMAQSIKCGAVKCLIKPFQISELKAMITSHIMK
jgi:two-component system response regulator QseB